MVTECCEVFSGNKPRENGVNIEYFGYCLYYHVMNDVISDCTSTHHTLILESETVSETLSNKVLFTW